MFDIQMFADVANNINGSLVGTIAGSGAYGDVSNLNVQTTVTPGLSPEMKEFYSKDLIELVEAELVHNQFAEHKPLPKNSGKIIEWRRWSNFKKALKPLQEGVTPSGSALEVTPVTKKVEQFGDYSTLSDVVQLTAIDPLIVEYTSKHASNARLTLDTIARNELLNGTQVIYGNNKESRAALDPDDDHLTPELVAKAVTQLKKQNAPKINGDYVCIIHPSVAFDLMRSEEWQNVKQYDPKDLYNGELGKLYGVRFVESTEAAVLKGGPLSNDSRALDVIGIEAGLTGTALKLAKPLTAAEATAIAEAEVLLWTGAAYEEATLGDTSYDAATDTLETSAPIEATNVDRIYPGGGGIETDTESTAVYPCIFLGKGAYGDVELSGGGMETIVKPLGSGGSADPLNQRGTIGWKCTGYGVKILIPEYIVRVEVTSSYSTVDEAN